MILCLLCGPVLAGTSEALLVRGAAKTISAALKIPFAIVGGAVQSFPLGIIGGAVQGTFSAVGQATSGAFDLARGAAPYAKYAVFL